MRKALALCGVLLLTGCTTIANPISQSRLDTINASWGATLALAANYRDACAARIIPATCRPVVVQLQRAAIPVQAAVQAANQAAVGGQTNALALTQAASDAINNYKVLQMQYGVK